MIVVADDDDVLVDLIREYLTAEGYEVRTARNGAEAYRQVREPHCKGCLLDFHMPGINGPELLLLLAAEANHIPVLLMTADPDFDEEEMKQFPNVKKMLRKPLVPEALLAAVRHYLEKPTRRK